MKQRQNRRVCLSPAVGVAVLSLCGSIGFACYDIVHTNWSAQGTLQEGVPCIWCLEIAWDGIVPGTQCAGPVSLVEGVTRYCYFGTVRFNQFGVPVCIYDTQYPTSVDYHPIICQVPCAQPFPR